MNNYKKIRLPEVVGKGYKTFWNSKVRYRVLKGSRGSKKSKTMALWLIYNIMKHIDSNALVVRKVFSNLRDSCYTDLLWAIDRLGVQHLWKATRSPLELVYSPTGQKILFRGLDDPLKLTSITVEKGHLCWCWINKSVQHIKINSSNCWKTLTNWTRGQSAAKLINIKKWGKYTSNIQKCNLA